MPNVATNVSDNTNRLNIFSSSRPRASFSKSLALLYRSERVQTTCQSALHPAKSLVFFIKPSTDKLKNDMAAECP
jgi:hypothetical protein